MWAESSENLKITRQNWAVFTVSRRCLGLRDRDISRRDRERDRDISVRDRDETRDTQTLSRDMSRDRDTSRDTQQVIYGITQIPSNSTLCISFSDDTLTFSKEEGNIGNNACLLLHVIFILEYL